MKPSTAPRKPSPSRCRPGSAKSTRGPLSVQEIAQALQDKPHLQDKIVRVQGDTALDKNKKLAEITKIVREDAQQQQQPDEFAAAAASLARPQPLTPLEEAQAAWRPTSEQLAAARKATLEQNARHEAAESKRIFKPSGRVWSSYGGEVVERSMLEHVDLIDARYLLSLNEHGGVLPRWQDTPASAKISKSNVWRLYGWERMFSLGILVLSYPWLDGDHPDKHGEMLARVCPILKHMLPFCGGDEFTVGVLWDYCSLPQPKKTPQQAERFKAGLTSLMTWYAHPYTHVLLMTSALPTGHVYTNTRPFDARGWTETERRTCGVSKCVHCMWDHSGWDESKLAGLEGMAAFDGLRALLKAGRAPPMSPPAFAKFLRERVASGELSFSAESDCDVVVGMYRTGFLSIFDTYREFDPDGFFAAWAAMEWGEAEAKQIANTLSFAAKHCSATASKVSLRFEGNKFGQAGQQAIEKAIKGCKSFSGVMF